MKKNLLKERFIRGDLSIGTWSSSGSANIVSVLCATPLDFIIIDMEHGSMSVEAAENLVRAAEAGGKAPIIRTSTDDPQALLRVLETGVRTVMVPHVDTAEKAQKVASACRYKPEGNRGLSPYTRVHGYSHASVSHSLETENLATLVGVLVEGKLGLENLESICAVPGIDFIYLGLFDICQSVGLPGQVNHPVVLEAVKSCADKIISSGKVAGCMATDLDYVTLLQKCGYSFIAYLNDCAALKAHFDSMFVKLHSSPE